MLYTIAPFANAGLSDDVSSPWGIRDSIALLVTLLITIVGAFFAGAKREIERMVASNVASTNELKAKVEKQADALTEVLTILLTQYNNKADLSERFSHLEASIQRDMAALNRRLDSLNVPPNK